MLETISIPIEIHDRFSAVLDRFQQAVVKSIETADKGGVAFNNWQKSSQSLQTAAVGAAAAWTAYSKTTDTVQSASLGASAAIGKASQALLSVKTNAQGIDSTFASIAEAVASSASSFISAAADYLSAGKSLAESLISGITQTLSAQAGRLLQAADNLLQSLTSKLSAAFSGIVGKIAGSLGALAISSFSSIISSAISSIGSLLKRAFGKPTVQEYAQSSGKSAAQAFGVGYTSEIDSWITQAAQEIAKRLGDETRKHMSEARWYPSVVSKMIDQMAAVTQADQDRLAAILEHHTKAVLVNVLKLSPARAAGEMAPVFEQIIAKVLESGETLSSYMLGMIQWAQSMGAQIQVPAEAFQQALQQLIETGRVGSEKFENLIQLAEQLGLSLQGGFQEGLAALQAELENTNSQIINIFEHELQFREQRLRYKRDFVQAAVEELQAQDASLSREQARSIALDRYKQLQQQVKELWSDGVVTLEELNTATEGMTQSEKKTFVELAKQRQERIALRSEEDQAAKLRETQQKLLQAINRLANALGGEFTNAASTLTDFQGSLETVQAPDIGLIGQIQQARSCLALFQSDLSSTQPNNVSSKPISGQGGFDYIFRGPSAGYPVPVILHGTERLTAAPLGKPDSTSGCVFNLTIHADSHLGGKTAADAFISEIQQALDTKRLKIPAYTIDTARL
jgi:hypothetical protein